MAETAAPIVVRSHVARDLMQTAGLFRNERLVVWEYVVNGLQYVDPGTNPSVRVSADSKRKCIGISDNGRGMDWNDLKNFFVMHGENLDRKQGRGGRGRFGTGKSAAFGIARILRVTTVRDGKRSTVELRRDAVEGMTSGEEIPVLVLEQEVATRQQNGTLIDIEDVQLKTIDQPGIIRYVERHLARWPKHVSVMINQHICEVSEPPLAFERRFRPEGIALAALGDVELIVKVSKRPLEEDERGVAVFSKGVWHDTTLGGCEGREMTKYIWGEIDVPRLEEDTSSIPPFDVSRSMRLNTNNELVRAVYAFVFDGAESVRKVLVEEEKSRRETDDARKLVSHAAEIAKVINDDFADFRNQVAKVRARASGPFDQVPALTKESLISQDLVEGGEVSGERIAESGGPGSDGGAGGKGTDPRELAPLLHAREDGDKKGKPVAPNERSRRPRGGFQVKFERQGPQSPRAKYTAEERTIYVNLDHPQVATALGTGNVDDLVFRRLAYEIAFAEYAIALAAILAQQGEFVDITDPIVHIGETLNRLARRGAHLYAANKP